MTRFLILMIFIASNSFAAGIQKWTDEKGNIHYGDTPPVRTKSESISVSRPPSNPGKPLPRFTGSEAEKKESEDKVDNDKPKGISTEQANKQICEKAQKDLDVISNNTVIRLKQNDGTERLLSDEEVDKHRTKLQQEIKKYCK